MSAIKSSCEVTKKGNSLVIQQESPSLVSKMIKCGRHLFYCESPSLKDRVLYFPNQLLQTLNPETFYKALKVTGVAVAISCLIFLPITGALAAQTAEAGNAQIYLCHRENCVAMNPQTLLNQMMIEANIPIDSGTLALGSQMLSQLHRKESVIVSKLAHKSQAIKNFDKLPTLPKEAIIFDDRHYPHVKPEFVTAPLMSAVDAEGHQLITIRYQEMDENSQPIGETFIATIAQSSEDPEKWDLIGSPAFFYEQEYFNDNIEFDAHELPAFYQLV